MKVFEDTEDLKEMSKGLQSFLDQEDSGDFEPTISCDQSPANDSSPPHISRGFEEESNGLMEGVLKSCFEGNMIPSDNAEILSTYETSDASATDYINDSENASLEYNSAEVDVKKDDSTKVEENDESMMEYTTEETAPVIIEKEVYIYIQLCFTISIKINKMMINLPLS